MINATKVFAVCVAAVVLAACTELGLPEQREILIPREKLNGLLARRLTLDKTLLDVLHLRTGEPAVVARIADGRVLLDPRTVAADETDALVDAVARAVLRA